MTETRPPAAATPELGPGGEAASEAAGPAVGGVFGTADHVALGRLWIGVSLLFLVATLVLAVVIGAETLHTATYDIFSQRSYAQAFSLEHVGFVFLTAVPLLIGVATIVVPRQLGAATVAFPRAAAAAFWGFLLGGGMVIASYLADGGPAGGSQDAINLFHVSLGFVCVSLILANITLATTVLALRPPGLSLHRAPAFAWSVLVASTLSIAGLAVLVGVLALSYIDNRYLAFNLKSSAEVWISFMRTPPQVFAIGIPVLGFAADVVPTLTGRPQKRHGIVLGAIGAFGVLAFGAWTIAAVGPTAHPHLYREALYTAMSAAVIVPVLAILGGVGESILKGKLVARPPLLFALGALVLLLAAAVVSALRVVAAFHLLGTTADDSVLFLVVGAAALAGVGGIHWWWPQVVGQHLKQPLAAAAGALLLLGTIVWAIPLVINGFLKEPLGSLGEVRSGVEPLNGVSMVGAGLLALGILVLVANMAGSLGRRTDDVSVPLDPWDGFTLEWSADPRAVLVTSATPLLDQKLAGQEGPRG